MFYHYEQADLLLSCLQTVFAEGFFFFFLIKQLSFCRPQSQREISLPVSLFLIMFFLYNVHKLTWTETVC